MFICRRFLQIGTVTLVLAGCASAPPGPTAAQPAPEPSGGNAPIRIGPARPADEPAAASTLTGALRPDARGYAEQLAAERGLALEPVVAALESARYNATVARLIAPSPPGRKVWRSWITYRARFVEPKRINWGLQFWEENQTLLTQAAQRYGVPASIIASIIGVETLYGRNMGSFRVLDALATLAFDYPDPAKPERAEMFRGQLGDFITLALQDKLALDARGSYAGAIGMPQFMPGSIRRYAVDGDHDGHIDLANSVADSVMSVGNFLVEHGWQRGLPVFAPVILPPDPAALASGGLQPTQTWASLRAAGARLAPGARADGWQDRPLGVVDLVEEARGTVQYRTATPNFFALTQYNRSYFYATAVADLAAALEARR
ncbi:lytic murein transglycosylase B [Bordetella petrii]|uniref:Membrane-bound lytic murein transglycosylase B n=1 Tax=Bordetella petrii (strain ATCC BAA-461 / DSM 12804 / CCUG 43448 / CIP 107267 / Se-1111R) TaxID=340100 RepID=A9IJK2_BORPD|nr:lytic murein transglycosylase B [Bordetella petrii]CAP42237.1 membrane-bound lytic murein transglycosylase B precursor [Bordetella petrii]